MEKKIKVRKIVDNALWDQFVKNSPHGTILSTSAWLQASADAQGGNPVKVGTWDGDNLIAGVSYVEVFKGTLKKATTPVLTPYGGFVYNSNPNDPGSDTESLKLLCAEKLIHFLQKNYHKVFLVHAPDFIDIRPFSWQGWTESVHYTYLLDINDSDTVWKNFRERTKRKIRKASNTLNIGGSISSEQIGEIQEKVIRSHGKIYAIKTVNILVNPMSKSVRTGISRFILVLNFTRINQSRQNDHPCLLLKNFLSKKSCGEFQGFLIIL